MHQRFDKLKSKVTGRSSSDSSMLEIGTVSGGFRRNSISNPMIVIAEALEDQQQKNQPTRNRLRAQSLSLMSGTGNPTSTSRSRSISKVQAKALIKQETAQIISKKLLHVLQDLGIRNPIPLETTSGGLRGPLSKTTKIYISNTNDCIYLDPATSASFTYEDVENGNLATNDGDLDNEINDESGAFNDTASACSNDSEELDSESDSVPGKLKRKMSDFQSPNYLCSKIDSENPIPHTFGIIIELTKETEVKDLRIQFQSAVNLLWPSGDPYNKVFAKEKFDIGNMEWQCKMSDADFYINTANSNDVKSKNITPTHLAERTRNYKLNTINHKNIRVASKYVSSSSRRSSIQLDNEATSPFPEVAPENCKAGLYVFLLPVLLPANMPATINSINGSLNHNLTINLHKISDKLNRKTKVNGSYNLPMVRTPPSFANSIADKPIYVNRVWNDSLHYIITFPKKYVALGTEHLINLKLVPLVKDVTIKRIKFNVLERITYVSKTLMKEYDYDSEDTYCLKAFSSENKVRERVVPICELTTKSKPSSHLAEPYKDEVISCPDNNLLFSCYESDLDDFTLNSNCDPIKKPDENHSMIATPLDVNISLPFLTTKIDKILQTSSLSQDIEGHSSTTFFTESRSRNSISSLTSPNLGPTSPALGPLEPGFSHGNEINLVHDESCTTPERSSMKTETSGRTNKEDIQRGYTSLPKALYPDSNFRNIQINHRLQVCFRISKRDPKDNFKMHHYEVVVDTPLILLSAKCHESSVQLPRYDEIDVAPVFEDSAQSSNKISFRTPNFNRNGISIKPLSEDDDQLPTFEEATSPLSSPVTRSMSVDEDPLSRIPSINIPSDPAPAYELPDASVPDNLMNQLNIDELVDLGIDSGDRFSRQSKIKSSLVNSFAPSASTFANEDNSSSLFSTRGGIFSSASDDSTDPSFDVPSNSKDKSKMEVDKGKFPPEEDANSTDEKNTPNTSDSSCKTISSADSIDQNDSDLIESNSSAMVSATDSSDPTDDAGLAAEDDSINNFDPLTISSKNMDSNTSLTEIPPQDDEPVSLFTQDTYNFTQRLPLLKNYSLDCVATQSSSINQSVSNFNNSKDNISISTESNLNQEQDFYHAY